MERKMVKETKKVENFNNFIDFTRFPVCGMLLINGREEFDMVNVSTMSYISKVKLAYNIKEDIVKIGFEDNSFELIAMDKCTEITINGVSIKSRKTFSDFANMVKHGAFTEFNNKSN